MTRRHIQNRWRAPRPTPGGCVLFSVWIGLALGALPGAARAQVFRVQAGTSSLYQTRGGSVYVQASNDEAMLGVGDLDPFRVGVTVRTRYRSADVTLGDAVIPFRLPTDVFDAGHSFLGRGLGVGYQTEDVNVFALGGVTSTGFSTPYTFGAEPDHAVGLCFLQGIVSPTVRVSARSLFSEKATTILGVDWTPSSYLGGALAGGAGSQAGYFATSMHYERERASVKAGFVRAGNQFHRVILPTPEGSEMDGPNVQVTVRPQPKLTLSAAHNGYLQPSSAYGPSARGTVNQVLAGGTAGGVSMNAAFFQSEAPGAGGTGVSFTAGREATRLLKLGASVMRSNPYAGAASTQWLASVREEISPRFALVQVGNFGGGNTNVSFGGSYTSNLVAASVEYQTIYVPFAVRDQFRQALMLNLRVQTVGSMQANVSSYVDPDGNVKYTAYVSQYLYRGESAPSAPAEQGIYGNVIRGVVSDEGGSRVPGAAIVIDGDVAYTNSEGEFLVRKKKAKEYAFEVRPAEFLAPGTWEVVHAPAQVEAVPEAGATDVMVLVRRLPAASN
jgi:hypothetical protein